MRIWHRQIAKMRVPTWLVVFALIVGIARAESGENQSTIKSFFQSAGTKITDAWSKLTKKDAKSSASPQ